MNGYRPQLNFHDSSRNNQADGNSYLGKSAVYTPLTKLMLLTQNTPTKANIRPRWICRNITKNTRKIQRKSARYHGKIRTSAKEYTVKNKKVIIFIRE